jgi:hypothetical protein
MRRENMDIAFGKMIIEKAGNRSILVFLTEDGELFEKSRSISGLYAGHDDLGLYIKKTVKDEAYITLIKWDFIVAVTNDINRFD